MGTTKFDLKDALLINKNRNSMLEKEINEILQKAHSLIILPLCDKVLREVAKEDSFATT